MAKYRLSKHMLVTLCAMRVKPKEYKWQGNGGLIHILNAGETGPCGLPQHSLQELAKTTNLNDCLQLVCMP